MLLKIERMGMVEVSWHFSCYAKGLFLLLLLHYVKNCGRYMYTIYQSTNIFIYLYFCGSNKRLQFEKKDKVHNAAC